MAWAIKLRTGLYKTEFMSGKRAVKLFPDAKTARSVAEGLPFKAEPVQVRVSIVKRRPPCTRVQK